MKLFYLTLVAILFLPSLHAFQAHDQNLAYTHPAIVVSNSVSYISVKDVPAGTPITSTAYWSPLLDTAPDEDPGDPPASEPDDSNISNVTPPDDTSSLADYNGTPMIARISVRGHVGTGDDERFMAFKLSGSASVMVRAVGEALGEYGLTNLMIDPEMRLYKYNDASNLSAGSTEQTEGSNDNYGSHSQASTIVSESANIFPSIILQSSESASITSLSSGYYSNQVFDKGYSSSNGSRIGWVGVDMISKDGDATFTSVATRGIVKPGDGAMYAGFEIIGNSSQTRKVFVRGRGASLADFGVSNVMSDAQLQLYKYTNAEKTESELIQLNDNYTSQANSSEISSKALELLSVGLSPTDPGMILDLYPGYYTIQFESVDGATGNGWIGIDDITE